MTPSQRLWLSAIIATTFYGGWSFFANSLVTDDFNTLLRSAAVQGVYSGMVTLLFTWLLERAYSKLGTRYFSFVFVVPLICLAHSRSQHAHQIRQSFNTALDKSAAWFKGVCWPGAAFSPLLPLITQSIVVIGVNLVNQTPNLLLTVLPSILFSGIYGYMYTLALYKKRRHSPDDDTLSKQTNV